MFMSYIFRIVFEIYIKLLKIVRESYLLNFKGSIINDYFWIWVYLLGLEFFKNVVCVFDYCNIFFNFIF